MNCRCGYDFAKSIMSCNGPCESYAVIRNFDYPAFLESEKAIAQQHDDTSLLDAIAQSSKYVGCLHECPECGRFLLVRPVASGRTPDIVVLTRGM